MVRIRPGDSTQEAETVRARSDNGRHKPDHKGLEVIRKYTSGPFFIISERHNKAGKQAGNGKRKRINNSRQMPDACHDTQSGCDAKSGRKNEEIRKTRISLTLDTKNTEDRTRHERTAAQTGSMARTAL